MIFFILHIIVNSAGPEPAIKGLFQKSITVKKILDKKRRNYEYNYNKFLFLQKKMI